MEGNFVYVKLIIGIKLLSLFFVCSPLLANELDYQVSVSTQATVQNSEDIEQGQRLDSDNLIVSPSLSLTYTSKRLQGFWRATHSNVRRSFEDNELTQNYTNYNYGGQISLIEGLLSFNANGGVSYQSPNLNGFQTDDFLLNSDNLAKTRRNLASLNLSVPAGDYFGFSSSISHSISESERTSTGFNGLDSNASTISSNFRTGNNFKRLYAQVSTVLSQQNRTEESGDYFSRQGVAEMSYKLIGDIGFTLTATNEGNQVSASNNVFSRARNFSTYGAGLTWRAREDRFLTLTINKSEGEQLGQEDEEDEAFLGINTRWQFTPRTSLTARYGRRVFGESGDFTFSHRIKKLRTQITYSEEITSFSNLISNPESLGVFVCADGARDLSACFQPSTLNYQLNPNEEFVQFSGQNTEISDELILRQALSWQLGMTQRRTSFSLNGRYSLNEYLETDRLNRTYSAGIVFGFEFGQKTSLSWNTEYSVSNNRFEGQSGESISISSSVGLTRSIGRHFELNLNMRYLELENEGDISTTGNGFSVAGIRGDLTDRRVSLSINYQYSAGQ